MEAALENYLFDLGQKAVRLHLKNQQPESVLAFLREFKDPNKGVFFVHGLNWGHPDEPGVYSTLNLQREFFVERQIRAVFWLTQNEIVNLARFGFGRIRTLFIVSLILITAYIYTRRRVFARGTRPPCPARAD